MKLLFPLLILSFSLQAAAQTRCDCFDRLINLGKHYENNYQFPRAIDVYKDAISFMDESATDEEIFWNICYCYDTLGYYDSSVAYAIKAIDAGLGANNIRNSVPKTYARLPEAKKLEKPLGPKVDWDLYNIVLGIRSVDQFVRGNDFYGEGWLPDSLVKYQQPIARAIGKLADSANYRMEMNILRKYGWPTFKKVGFYNAMDLRVLMHNVRYPGYGRKLLDTLYVLGSICEGIRRSTVLKLEDNRVLNGGEPGLGEGKNLVGFWGRNRYNIIYDISKADSIRLANNHVRLKEDVPPGESLPKDYKPIPYPKNYFCLKKYQIQ
jgi:tetratricopeptide (TPR) repeat protein